MNDTTITVVGNLTDTPELRVSPSGVPLVRFIDIDDSEAVLRAIRQTDDGTPIDIVLHTPG